MRRVSFNPFKQREINVSVDTFCKIERFRHRRHICSYVKKKEKKMRRHLSLRPSFFPFLSYSFLPLFFIFLLFSFFFLIHSLARRMLTERERERGAIPYAISYASYTVAMIRGVKKGIRRIDDRRKPVFVPAPGWSIVHVFDRFP